jgi:hypothetical protein
MDRWLETLRIALEQNYRRLDTVLAEMEKPKKQRRKRK